MKKVIQYVFMVFLSLSVVACNPMKVTDPNDPNFDPKEFRFEDVEDSSELQAVLDTMFPPGTTRDYVENILIDHAKLKPSAHFVREDYKPQDDGAYVVVYSQEGDVWYSLTSIKSSGLRQAQFTYDKKHNVIKIRAHFFNVYSGYPFLSGRAIKKGEKP